MRTLELIAWILGLLLIAFVGYSLREYSYTIHDRLTASCNATGGSYIGGMCIHVETKDPVYEWCLSEVRTQEGVFAVLPMKCAKYTENLFINQ